MTSERDIESLKRPTREDPQTSLFPDIEPDWRAEWWGMPEYNVRNKKPAIIALFKFENNKDFEEFKSVIQKHLYNNENPFRPSRVQAGGQKKIKQAWYPQTEIASSFKVGEE